MVPFPVRLVRGLLITLLVLVCVPAGAIAVMAFWGLAFNREGISVEEATNFGGAAAVVFVLSLVLIAGARRIGTVTIRGRLQQPSLERVPRGRGSRTSTFLLAFTLEVTDRHQHRFPLVPVELRWTAREYHARLTPGEEVVVKGRPKRGNYLAARFLRSERSGLTIR